MLHSPFLKFSSHIYSIYDSEELKCMFLLKDSKARKES